MALYNALSNVGDSYSIVKDLINMESDRINALMNDSITMVVLPSDAALSDSFVAKLKGDSDLRMDLMLELAFDLYDKLENLDGETIYAQSGSDYTVKNSHVCKQNECIKPILITNTSEGALYGIDKLISSLTE